MNVKIAVGFQKMVLGGVFWLILTAVFGFVGAPAQGAGLPFSGRLELVRNGRPVSTIVLSRHPSRSAAFAVMELQDHIQKITGARLPIKTDDVKITGARILVGESAATQALGIRSQDFKSQEYLVQFLPNALVLIGRDEDDKIVASDHSRPQRVAGKFGQALGCNGHNFIYALPDTFPDDTGSMEAWVWLPAAPPAGIGTILRLHTSHEWSWHEILRQGNQIVYDVGSYDRESRRGKDFFKRVSSKPLMEGWHYILATHNASEQKMELFIDSVSQGTETYLPTACSKAGLQIGAHIAGDGSPRNAFTGLIDEVRISDVVRPLDSANWKNPYDRDAHTNLMLHFDETNGIADDAILAPPDCFEEHGTLNAAYYFLQRDCGVHWYVPGDIGTVYPVSGNLSARGETIRRIPDMKHRTLAGVPIGHTLRMPTATDVLSARDHMLWSLRMNIGGQRFTSNHAFYGYYDRFLKTHPDWFAQGYENDKDETRPPQMCYTNPEFIRQVVQDARDYFDGKGLKVGGVGMGDMFALGPMDNNKWCKCPRCQAELNQAEKNNPQWFSSGYASDYIWNFVNKVAIEIKKSHPDKFLVNFAYYDYSYYPTKIRLETNIIVQRCQSPRVWWAPSNKANDLKVFRSWTEAEKDRPIYLWLYYLAPAACAKDGHWYCFPGFCAHAMVQQMKMYHDAGIRGFFIEHTSEFDESYLFDQLELYVTFRLADDPTLDGNALIAEFFDRYYGSAAKPMKAFYEEVEDTFSDSVNYPMEIQTSPNQFAQTNEIAWGSLGTSERMAKLAGFMIEAKRLARTEAEKTRVAFFERGIWDYMVTGRKNYELQHPGSTH